MKVRQPYDEPVVVPWLDGRTVNPGQVVDVAAGQMAGFLAAGWTPADAEAKKAASEDTGKTTAAAAGQEG